MTDGLTRWQALAAAQLLTHTWSGERYLVYSRPSGETHYLDALAMLALAALQERDMSAPELAAQLAEALGEAAADAAIEARSRDILADLDRAGLVSPA